MKTKTERVDDIPLLIAAFEKSNLSELLNEYFPTHGNWQGLDIGRITVVFLSYILSCGDHRLSHVEPWALARLETLRYCMKNDGMTSKDFTDDKLGLLLDKYSDIEAWDKFESAHNQELINIYDLSLKEEPIRLDAMITQSHREASGDFQFGYSKHHRADLPQLKTMVATLDPLAMPLASCTVAGNISDDVLYLPVISKCEELGLEHPLFVGDSKMGSQKIRHYLQEKGYYYLTPLNRKQCGNKTLNEYLDDQPTELATLYRTGKKKDGEVQEVKAKAFETKSMVEYVTDSGVRYDWEERRIVVYSPAYGESQRNILEKQILKAKNNLDIILQAKSGRKKLKTMKAVELSIENILQKFRVKQFFKIIVNEKITSRTIQKYKNRPKREEHTSEFTLDIQIDEVKKQQYMDRLGWRVYASNAPLDILGTEQAVICYRNEYRIEHKFDELMNRVTALLPVFLQKEHRIKSLVRLLLVALKFVSVIEYQVKTVLETEQQSMKGLYAGNPARKTNKPSIGMILRAFNNIHFNIISIEDKVHVTISELKPIQIQILKTLNIPIDVYLGMNQLLFTNFDFSET